MVVRSQRWHVVYTMPKSEKKVAASIRELGFESYLPLQKEIRQWSDRKKKIEVPLFPNYVFVKVDERSRMSLFSIRELVRFVCIEKKPVVIKEEEIIAIKSVLKGDYEVTSDDYFQTGSLVKIHYGKFAGVEGVIVQKRGRARLLIKIDGIMKAFSFNISVCDVTVFHNTFGLGKP